jgi:hypothetical protein
MGSRLRFTWQGAIATAVTLALLVFTIQPRNVRGQARVEQARVEVEIEESEIFTDSATSAKPDLKSVFDKEIATLKSGTTRTDFNRFSPTAQTQQSGGKFTRKQKLFLALWIVCMTALVIVAIKHPCREKRPHDCDPIDDTYY